MSELEFLEVFCKAHQRLVKKFLPLLKREGLSGPEFFVMWKVKKRVSCRVTDLAEETGIPPSTLTGILDRLEERGFIRRTPDQSDRRSILVKGTPYLESFLEQLTTGIEKVLQYTLGSLSRPELLDRLTHDLRLLIASLESGEGETD